MILHPLENKPIFKGGWSQKRPKITQGFGGNEHIYKQFGMKGHNGRDYGIPEGTPIYASFDGKVKVKDSKEEGYGLHIKLRSSYRAREVVLGHLSKVIVKDGAEVHLGDLIGYTGNTGFSTGPHLHMGLRYLIPQSGDVFKWEVLDHDNGYYGYVDHGPFTITFKGTEEDYSLSPNH